MSALRTMSTPNWEHIKGTEERESCFTASIKRPSLLTKRQRDEENSEGEDESYHVKRYLSEEQMASRLEHLQIVSPPYVTPSCTTPPYTAEGYETLPTDDWNLSSHESDMISLDTFDKTNLLTISLNQETTPTQDIATPLEYDFQDVPTDDESIFDEENSSDSSDDVTPPQIWIAPEVKTVLNNSSHKLANLLPPEVFNEINKPCTALILYKQPEHVREMLWKGHVGSLSPYKEHKPQDTERTGTSAVISQEDEMELDQ